MATLSSKRRQQLMDQAQKKEALSRSKKELTPEMRVKIKVMAKRSKAAGSSHCAELDVPSMARAIRSKAVAADERLTDAANKALRFIRKPKPLLNK